MLFRGSLKASPREIFEVASTIAKSNSGGEDRAKVKLRVIEFELEGANSSVENSIRQQLTAALTARTNATLKLPPGKQPNDLASGDAAQRYQEPEELEAEIVAEDADAPPAKTKSAKPRSKPKPPTYLPDLITDFDGFKSFVKQRCRKAGRSNIWWRHTGLKNTAAAQS